MSGLVWIQTVLYADAISWNNFSEKVVFEKKSAGDKKAPKITQWVKS